MGDAAATIFGWGRNVRLPGLVGSSVPSQSPLANNESTINFFVDYVERTGAGTLPVLYPTAGQTPWVTVSDIGCRAFLTAGSRAFAVIGSTLYELFATATATNRGTVAQDSQPATISWNGTPGGQLFITSGGHGYCYVLSTNTLTQVLTSEADQGAMLDGYFIAFNRTNGHLRLSALNDGTSWDPTQFAARSIAPDPWQAMVVGNRELWLIGSETGEVWYDAGAFPFPFAPIPGAVFQYGTRAPWTVSFVGDSVMWLANTSGGATTVVQATGYTPQRVSSTAIDTMLDALAQTSGVTDAEALICDENGHVFYVLNFPAANQTWTYDRRTTLWHQRGTYNLMTGGFDLWSPRVHGAAFNQHLVGSRTSGQITTLETAMSTEADGRVVRRRRLPPALWVKDRTSRTVIDRLELDLEPGLGTATGQGVTPLVMLRTTTNGKTFGSELRASAGAMGQYGTRVRWHRLGSTDRLWQPEITVTDPVPWCLLGAEVTTRGSLGALT